VTLGTTRSAVDEEVALGAQLGAARAGRSRRWVVDEPALRKAGRVEGLPPPSLTAMEMASPG
jgi:predicted pyridoxine 5'-phosphate oxidase superfamily flavin-nucleotide-binding protein